MAFTPRTFPQFDEESEDLAERPEDRDRGFLWARRLRLRWRAVMEDLVLPGSCVLCGTPYAPLSSALCEGCREELADGNLVMCRRCGTAQRSAVFDVNANANASANVNKEVADCAACRDLDWALDGVIALGPYHGPIRHLCLQLKHWQGSWLAPGLMDVLMLNRREELESRIGRRDRSAECVTTPIPLHWRRRWWRGYNQSDALAFAFSQKTGIPLCPILTRRRATPKLAGMSASLRRDWLRKSFSMRAGMRPMVQGKQVFLVDDILTTGATCNAAARALKRAGAKTVVAVVLGRTDKPLSV